MLVRAQHLQGLESACNQSENILRRNNDVVACTLNSKIAKVAHSQSPEAMRGQSENILQRNKNNVVCALNPTVGKAAALL